MNSRTARVARCARWGIGSLAVCAGAAVAQQSGNQDWNSPSNQSNQQSTWSSTNQQDWKRADYIPQLSSVPFVLLTKDTDTGKTVTLAIDHGQVTAAQVDGQDATLDRVQMKGDKIKITDENKTQSLAEIKIPQNIQSLASGRQGFRGYNEQRFGTNEGRFSDQDYSRNFNQNQGGQDSSQRYYPTQDRYTYTDRSSSTQTDRDRYYQPDRSTYTERYQDRYYQPGSDRSTYSEQYRNRYYQPDMDRSTMSSRDRYPQDSGGYRYDPNAQPSDQTYRPGQGHQTYRSGGYRSDQDMGYRSDRTMGTTERSYTTYEFNRPVLGVMMSEADSSDLRAAGVSTSRYSNGIMIDQVNQGMPAERAGLQKGDIIVSIDGQTPATAETLRDALARKDFNDPLRVVVLRNGQERNMNVRLFQPQSGNFNRNYYNNDQTNEHDMPQNVPGDPNGSFDPGTRDSRDYRGRNYGNENQTYRPRQF